MSYTKRQIIVDALDEIGIASYIFDAEPEAYQSAMRRLDNMMAEWNGRGIRLGYPIPTTPGGGDLDDDAGVPDKARQAIVSNLAIRIAPTYGKQVMRETKVVARQALQSIMVSRPPNMQLRSMPSGAGNKPHRTQEYIYETTPLDAGNDGELEL